jgi:hypothetical protein
MSYFHRPDAALDEEPEPGAAPRSPFADFGDRVARWFASPDRGPVDESEAGLDPTYELIAGSPDGQDPAPRFPLAPFGYNRVAVDAQLAELEDELEQLRVRHEPPISITEEIERIGEQTASILVVAHDKAHETTRLAQEQADRCIADAASNAVAMTNQAKQRLAELDGETDAVWHERERLIEDVRVVSAALASLAEQATERFPAESKGPAGQTTFS